MLEPGQDKDAAEELLRLAIAVAAADISGASPSRWEAAGSPSRRTGTEVIFPTGATNAALHLCSGAIPAAKGGVSLR